VKVFFAITAHFRSTEISTRQGVEHIPGPLMTHGGHGGSSFDHFVGEREQFRRHSEAERVRGLDYFRKASTVEGSKIFT